MFLILLAICLLALPMNTKAQENDHKGKVFWFGYMESFAINKIKVYITFSELSLPDLDTAKIQVSVPGKLWDRSFIVKNHSSLVVDVPIAFGYVNTDDFIDSRAVRVIATENVEVRIALQSNKSMATATVLPFSKLTKAPTYYANTYLGSDVNKSQILLVAPENNTKVEITPNVDLLGGQPANRSFTITLNAGGTYQMKAERNGRLQGTKIRVIDGCQKLAVFSGNECSTVSGDVGCVGCDQLMTQLKPTEYWGSEYVLLPFYNTTRGFLYDITSAEDNNDLYVNGVFYGTINKGESKTIDELSANTLRVTSSKPSAVYQYIKSGSCLAEANGKGDPSMFQVAGFNLRTTAASVKPPHTPNVRTHWVAVVTKTANIPLFKLDNMVRPNTDFNLLMPGSPYSVGYFSIDDSIHFLQSDSGFYAISYGYGVDESYAYTLSSDVSQANYEWDIELPYLCVGDKPMEFKIKGDSAINAYWEFGNGDKATGLNVFHLPPKDSAKYSVRVVIENTNSACPLDTINRIFPIYRAPQVDVGPSDTIICIGERITFQVNLPNVNYLWSNGSTSNSIFTTKAGTFHVTVTDKNGCISSDTVDVQVISCEDTTIFIPNVMTPDGDGLNDKFDIKYGNFKRVTGKIINRWGQEIYTFTLPEQEPWNGNISNETIICPPGTYFYVLNFEDSNTKANFTAHGVITVIRKD